VSPLRKVTTHAMDGEKATGDADQNQVAGVEGKEFGSITGAVDCE
jgi:hypothetical protein